MSYSVGGDVKGCFVPKNTRFDCIFLGSFVVTHQTLIVFGTRIHHSRKMFVPIKEAEELTVQTFPVLDHIFTKRENVC